MEERERLRAWERFAQNEGLLGSGGIRQPRLCAPRLEAEQVLAGGVGGRRLELLRLSPILGGGEVVVESKYFLFFKLEQDLRFTTRYRKGASAYIPKFNPWRSACVCPAQHVRCVSGRYCCIPVLLGTRPSSCVQPCQPPSPHCHLCPPHWASVPCSDPLQTRSSGPSGIWLVS